MRARHLVLFALLACGGPQAAAPAPPPAEPAPAAEDDACPGEDEDLDGFRDDDGCPDLDNDGDRVADTEDMCPCNAEDLDGFQDEDGCPDRDNDQDGISDECDRCPVDPEVHNGFEDDDGCPDTARILVSASEIRILEHLYFELRSDALRPQDMPMIEELARVMLEYPNITRVEVQGFASRGERGAQPLSERRAEAVRRALVDRGVDGARLVVRGYGDTRPRAPEDTADNRARNRRVELQILEMEQPPSPAPPPPMPPCDPAPDVDVCEAWRVAREAG